MGKNKLGIIYAYTNLDSGKMYIGQTINPKRRFRAHLKDKTKGWHTDYQNNPDKYEYSIIETDISLELLDEREKYWIKFFNSFKNGYNLTEGGSCFDENHRKKISDSNKGKTPWNKGKTGVYTNETINKIKEARAKQLITQEARLKLSKLYTGEGNPFYGKKHTDEAKQKISNSHKGKTLTEETKQKMSITRQNRKWYNNGVVEKWLHPNEVPDGFIKGRLKRKYNKD